MDEHRSRLNVPKKRLCWPPLGLRPARPDQRRGRPALGRPCHACHRAHAQRPVVARAVGFGRAAASALLGLRGEAAGACHTLDHDARGVLGERDRGGAVKGMA